MVKIIAELGSCHMGKFEYVKEAIDRCKDSGIDALKLQLFPNKKPYVPTNVWLDPKLFSRAFDYALGKGLDVSASVFDQKSLDFLISHRPEFIKLAFSKKHEKDQVEEILYQNIQAIVSCDVMTDKNVDKRAVKLYCIPEYPVRYEVAFDGLFPRFDGFSDHTLGMRQTKRAVEAGAEIIEKHVMLPHVDITCPDSFFAVSIEELGELKK